MRTLKYAILGLLNQNDMSGYDMSEAFGETLNEFWHAKHSQIYPELKKLTDEGMVMAEEDETSNRSRKVYHITNKGREDFMAWLGKDEDLPETPKDIFRLRVFFFSRLPMDTRRKLMDSQKLAHELRLRHLESNKQAKGFNQNIPAKDDDAWGDYLVLMSAIMREEMMIDWCNRCLELMK